MCKPAKKGDVIEVIESHYVCEFKVGERFVALDVFNGDDTAVVMDKDGKIGTLCFPEEYNVVDTAENLVKQWIEENTVKVPDNEKTLDDTLEGWKKTLNESKNSDNK